MAVGDKTTIVRPFAGSARRFCLRPEQIDLLETKYGSGPLELVGTFVGRRWRLCVVRDVLQLGLIGAGVSESEATIAVREGIVGPLQLCAMLAMEVLFAAIVGETDTESAMAEALSSIASGGQELN